MIYLITDGEFIKLGKSKSVKQRFSAHQTSNPRELTIIAAFECIDDHQAEKHLKDKFAQCQVRGEWFDVPARDLIQAVLKSGMLLEPGKHTLPQCNLVLNNEFHTNAEFIDFLRTLSGEESYKFEIEVALFDSSANKEMNEKYKRYLSDKRQHLDNDAIAKHWKECAKASLLELKALFTENPLGK